MENALLQTAAGGGSLDYGIWPDLLPRLIVRLEKIARNEFPTPTIEVPSAQFFSPSPAQYRLAEPDSPLLSSQNPVDFSQFGADKENVPTLSQYQSSSQISNPEDKLPAPMITLLSSITQTLATYFPKYPPHTIQRLSELLLAPKKYYRTLPSYLHAVDRVVHVTSGANIYPLPAAMQDLKALPNGAHNALDLDSISWGTITHNPPGFGSDDSLGGALLTPIPWLQPQYEGPNHRSGDKLTRELEGGLVTDITVAIDGPKGAGRAETVSASVNGILSVTAPLNSNRENCGGLRAEGGITQGELLRQEQCAGVVPAAQLTPVCVSGDIDGPKAEDDEIPHARGPQEIGMEDMGPQVVGSVGIVMQGIDVEAAVGRKTDNIDQDGLGGDQAPSTPKRAASDEMESDSKRIKDHPLIIEGKQCVEVEGIALAEADSKKA